MSVESGFPRGKRWGRLLFLAPWFLPGAFGCMIHGTRPTTRPAAPQAVISEAAESIRVARLGPPSGKGGPEGTVLAQGPLAPAAPATGDVAGGIVRLQFTTVPPGDNHAAEEADEGLRLDLGTVLGMASGANLQIASARERVNEAYARQLAAQTLWLPTLRAGVSWNKHDGNIQDVVGKVFNTNRASLSTGWGSGAVGAGSPAFPGLSARFHLKDALFEPRIAREVTAANQQAANAATNDTVLAASLLYLDLLDAEQQRAIAAGIAAKAKELADLTAAYAKSGEGSQADADRARTEWMLRRNNIDRAGERSAVVAARLRELVRLNQDTRLVPSEPAIVPLELVPADLPVRELIALGLTNRPELAENRSLVAAAAEKLRSDRLSPWIPSLLLGVSYGGLGGSQGSAIDNFRDRLDLDVGAYWEVRNLGFGEKAARDGARSRLEQARLAELRRMDQIAREIAELHAQVGFRKRQIPVAEEGVQAATASLRRNLERIRERQGLPLEVLQSIQALDLAQREYLRTLVEYNQAQFRLQWALGWIDPLGSDPARCVPVVNERPAHSPALVPKPG